jgi:hypothetical protein
VRLPVDRFLAHHANYAVLGQAESLLAVRKTKPSEDVEITPLDRAYSMMWYLPLEAHRKFNKWKTQKKRAA